MRLTCPGESTTTLTHLSIIVLQWFPNFFSLDYTLVAHLCKLYPSMVNGKEGARWLRVGFFGGSAILQGCVQCSLWACHTKLPRSRDPLGFWACWGAEHSSMIGVWTMKDADEKRVQPDGSPVCCSSGRATAGLSVLCEEDPCSRVERVSSDRGTLMEWQLVQA